MKSFDNKETSKYITYLDANNFHGWAMSQYLSYSEFKWLNQEEINKFDLNLIGGNGSIGYTIEIDLEYPDELHELHNDYPLSLENLKISHSMLPND